MGHLNHHLLKNLRALGDELEEAELASPPPEPTENHLLDVPLHAFDWVSLLPELEDEVDYAVASDRIPAELSVIILRL